MGIAAIKALVEVARVNGPESSKSWRALGEAFNMWLFMRHGIYLGRSQCTRFLRERYKKEKT